MDIFHDWSKSEIEAMKRATAWLRSIQRPKPESRKPTQKLKLWTNPAPTSNTRKMK